MNRELTLKLVQRFPVIYQDFYSPMQETCMCWGFDHGDGWFHIIWQLSLAIEEELGYGEEQKENFLFKKKYARKWNKFIYSLSPAVHDITKLVKGEDNVWRHVLVEKVYPRDQWLRDLLLKILPNRSDDMDSWIGHFQRLGLKAFVWHPDTGFRVDQVKEKFGTLRYYCSSNKTIDKYISMAEALTGITCEVCGKPGKMESPGGWYSVVCKDHSRIKEEEHE